MPTWTLIGSDDFTESSNTNLESHTPSGANALASAWTHLPFQGGYSLVVNAAADAVGQPYHGGSGYRNPYVIGPSANAVQRADCTGIDSGKLGLLLLASSDTTYYKGYLLTHEAFTNRAFRIYRIDAGVATQIKAGSTFDGLTGADTVSFRVDASGNFTVWKNGVQNTELNVTDTTYTTGKPGIHGAKTSPNTLDNFSAYHEAGGGTHTTTGAITGQGATVAGTSTHLTLHTTSGAITGQGATVAGVAVHPHTTTGIITGQGATVAGVAVHPHTTTGVITGQGATVAGASEHTAAGHTTSGAITGQGATVAGVSTHLSLHTTTGAITGQGATVAGVAVHPHTTSGAITGQGATVSGTAVSSGTPTLTQADIDAIAAAVFAYMVDGNITFAQSIRLQNSVLAGKVSGAGTGTEIFRDINDTKDRIVATVDSSGNRTGITLDAT